MKKFEAPVVDVVRYSVADVITSSSGGVTTPSTPTTPTGGNSTTWN